MIIASSAVTIATPDHTHAVIAMDAIRRGKQMLNHIRFIRRTAAVLLAGGLIVSLLPGLAAAQDRSTPPTGNVTIPPFQEEAISNSDQLAPFEK